MSPATQTDLHRMTEQLRCLGEDLGDMSKFFRWMGFPDLDLAEQARLERQFRAMQNYAEALGERISACHQLAAV